MRHLKGNANREKDGIVRTVIVARADAGQILLPVHFADAYLASSAAISGTPIYSFDEDFGRFKDITWKH